MAVSEAASTIVVAASVDEVAASIEEVEVGTAAVAMEGTEVWDIAMVCHLMARLPVRGAEAGVVMEVEAGDMMIVGHATLTTSPCPREVGIEIVMVAIEVVEAAEVGMEGIGVVLDRRGRMRVAGSMMTVGRGDAISKALAR